MAPWCSGCTTSFNKAWTQVLRRLKPCLRRVGDSRWWRSLTVVPAGNKAKRFSSVNHTTETIHHHHHYHHHHHITFRSKIKGKGLLSNAVFWLVSPFICLLVFKVFTVNLNPLFIWYMKVVTWSSSLSSWIYQFFPSFTIKKNPLTV